MQRKLTITLDEHVYEGLYKTIGRRHISQFIEDLVRPYVIISELEQGYAAMAADTQREVEALEWSEGLLGETNYEAR